METSRLGEDAKLPGARYGLGPVGHVQLGIDVGRVGFDGARGDDELLRDLWIGPSQGNQVKHLTFARAQGLDQGLLPSCLGRTGEGGRSLLHGRARFGLKLGKQLDRMVSRGTGAGAGQPASEKRLHRLALV